MADHEPVHELIDRHIDEIPHAVAVEWQGDRLSYRELGARAAAIARMLRAGGPVSGRPVAVRLPQGLGQVVAVLGALRAGAHVVCQGTGEVGERGRAVLAELRPAALVTEGRAADDPVARWFRDVLGGRVLDLARGGGGGRSAGAASADDHGTAHEETGHAERDDLAYVAYTSGTTGRPKGIPHTHATLSQFVTWFAAEFGIGRRARFAQWAAPGYDANLMEIFTALVAGATLCPVPDRIRINPERLVGWLAAERITHFQTVPTFARACLPALRELRDLEHLLLAGEPLTARLVRALRSALPGVRITNLYGPTESILATWGEAVDEPDATVVPVGRPIPGRQVLVVDAADRPCPPGVEGEIVIVSPHVTPGYVGRPNDPAFRPLPGHSWPTYRTGDLGRWREDGLLEFHGRRDSQIKFNGRRLELADIESALAAQRSIAECAVRAETDTGGLVTRLVAHVVPADAQATPATWRAALRQVFGATVPPMSFVIMNELPRNAGGKVDRLTLAASQPLIGSET